MCASRRDGDPTPGAPRDGFVHVLTCFSVLSPAPHRCSLCPSSTKLIHVPSCLSMLYLDWVSKWRHSRPHLGFNLGLAASFFGSIRYLYDTNSLDLVTQYLQLTRVLRFFFLPCRSATQLNGATKAIMGVCVHKANLSLHRHVE